jgi:hypothetical protein
MTQPVITVTPPPALDITIIALDVDGAPSVSEVVQVVNVTQPASTQVTVSGVAINVLPIEVGGPNDGIKVVGSEIRLDIDSLPVG